MDIFECLHTRRSVRQYGDEPVSDEQVRILLDAAMIAPSGGNEQPWHFVVVRDKELLLKVSKTHQYIGMAAKAPLGVLVCGNLDEERYEGLWVQDCSAATQNLLLAATALGLGAVWTAVHPFAEREAACRELFNLPERVIPFSFLVIGHPKEAPARKSRYNEAKVHRERW